MVANPTPTQQILTIIEQHRSFVVTGHERPDGDAVGSSLALWQALKQLGKQVECVLRSGLPRVYSFLPGADAVQTEPSMSQPQVVIVVDCDGRHRVDVAAEVMKQAQRVIDIDHHGANPPFGDVAHRDTEACAVGEMIYRLLNAGGIAIDAAIAACLYCAIATDTGFFRFQNTTPAALTVCSDLIRAGANPHLIARRAADEQPLSSTILLGRALASAQPTAGGAIVTARLLPEDFAVARADSEDVEGIVERLKFVEGAQAVALLRDEGRGEIRVSLRAAAGVDVRHVAQKFGGGGHVAAAGCTIRGTMEDAHEAVASELRAAVV